jgi:hypothetical protein
MSSAWGIGELEYNPQIKNPSAEAASQNSEAEPLHWEILQVTVIRTYNVQAVKTMAFRPTGRSIRLYFTFLGFHSLASR